MMITTNNRRTQATIINLQRRWFARPMVRELEERVTPATFTVVNTLDTGVGSLRQAIIDANSIHEAHDIDFALPSGPQTISLLTALPTINGAIDVLGPGAKNLTIRRDAAAVTQFRIFTVNNVDVPISPSFFKYLTISGGRSSASGAGISFSGNGLGLWDMVFQDNFAIGGDGGAVDISQGSLSVDGCTFTFNLASGSGGAIATHNANTNGFFDSTWADNFAGSNGGGGAVAILGINGLPSFYQCTITENFAPGLKGGGGIYCDAASSEIYLSETVVSGNTGINGLPDDILTSGKVSAQYSALGVIGGITSYNDQGGNIIGADLKLGSLDYHGSSALVIPLSPGSKAINAGISGTNGNPFDQRGLPRHASGTNDIGAYEAQLPTIPVFGVVFPPVTTVGGTTYSFAITYEDQDFDVGGLDISSLDNNDVQVTGPNGFNVPGHFVKATTTGNLTTATYEITPPGGFWDGADNGMYTIVPNLNQVFDTTGFAVKPPVVVGTFQVATSFLVTNGNDGAVTKAGDKPGSLRQAIFDANIFPGADTITFDPGFFGLPRTITLTQGQLDITDPISIVGSGEQILTINGNLKSRIFNFVDTGSTFACSLSQMLLTGGKSATDGGAIRFTNHDLTITSCTIGENLSGSSGSGGSGGGIQGIGKLTMTNCTVAANVALQGAGAGINMSGTLTLIGCNITNNVTDNGSGGGIQLSGALTMTDCLVANNHSINGGGVHANGTVFVSRCTFADNISSITGGGLWASGLLLSIESSTFANNQTQSAGGGLIHLTDDGATVQVRNSTFVGNMAPQGGGLELKTKSNYVIRSCTIVNNNATNTGGGISASSNVESIALESSIVSGNLAGTAFTGNFDVPMLSAKNCGVASFDGITTFQNLGGNIVGGNFNLQPLGNYGGTTQTIALGEGSVIIDQGSNPSNLFFDQRGFSRANGTPDIGSFETIRPTAKATNTFADVLTKGGTSYILSVTFADVDTGIDASTVDDGDEIRITGPNAFDVLAAFQSFDAKTGIASYQFTPHGGTWTAIDNGTYTITIEAGQVFDTTALGVLSGMLGTFQVTIPDTTPPSASLTFNDTPTKGAVLHTLKVTYSDDVRVKVSTLDGGDIRIQGPAGFNVLAMFQSVDVNTDGSPRVATYTFTPPGGTWDGFDLGTYTVSMVANEVTDTAGLAVLAGTLGTFMFDLPNTVVWDGGAGNANWTSGQNWNHDLLPTATEDVFINSATSVTLNVGGTRTILSLNCATSFLQTNGTLVLNAASYINGKWTMSGGTLDGSADLTIAGQGTWSGGQLIGSGKLLIAPLATLSVMTTGACQYGRSIENAGAVVWTGTIRVDTFAGASWLNLAGSSFDAQSTGSWGFDNTPFTNAPGSIFKRTAGAGTVQFNVALHHQSGLIAISSGALELDAGGTWPNDVSFTGDLRLVHGGFSLQKVSGDHLTVGTLFGSGASVTAILQVAQLSQDGGTLNISAASTADKWSLTNGILQGSGDLTVTGTSTWSGGQLLGSGKLVFAAGATLAVTCVGACQYGRNIENNGAVIWNGPIRVDTLGGGSWTNRTGSSFDAQSNNSWGNDASPFTNEPGSSFARSTGAGTASFGVPFNHQAGPIVISKGILELDNGGVWPNDVDFTGDLRLIHGGFSLQKISGVHLTVGAVFSPPSVAAIIQVIDLTNDGGTITLNGVSNVANQWSMSSGTLQGAGEMTINGASTWSGGQLLGSGKLVFAAGATLAVTCIGACQYGRAIENNGAVIWNGPVRVDTLGGGSWINHAGSSFDAQSNNSWGNDASPFSNEPGSTFIRSTGAGTASFGVPFNHQAGPIVISKGILELDNGGVWPSDVTFTGDLQMIHGGYSLQKVSGDHLTVGTMFGIGASVSASIQVTVLTQAGGALSISAASTADKWTLSNATLDGPGDLIVGGQSTWSSGTLVGTGRVLIASSATLAITTAASTQLGRPIENSGAVVWSGTNTVTTLNGGSWLNLDQSTFDAQANGTWGNGNMPFTVSLGSKLLRSTAAGTAVFNNVLTNNGTLEVQSGTLHLVAGLTNFTGSTLSGGMFVIIGTLQFPNANIATNAASIVFSDIAGQILNSTNGLSALASFTTNAPVGSFTLLNGKSQTVPNTFTNQGTLTVGGGSTFATAIGDYIQTGGITIVAGTLDPAGDFLLQGGTLNSSGKVLADVLNTGGMVSPGNSPGVLIINGNYAQGGAGALNIELNGLTPGTQHDQLVVNGTVTLGGTLQVSLGYAPQVGDSFVILDNDGSDSITGTFTNVAEGDFITLPTAKLQITYKGGTNNNDVVVSVASLAMPAKVSTFEINGGQTQRSRVTSLQVTFDQIVSFEGTPMSAFVLSRQKDGKLPTLMADVNNSGPGSVVTLSFTGTNAVDFGSLADGIYTLTILSSQIPNFDGQGPGGNFELVGNTTTNKLFRLFGDANGDGTVTAADFNAFRVAYGITGPSIFDYDGDNQVTAADFNQFRTRYGIALVP